MTGLILTCGVEMGLISLGKWSISKIGVREVFA